MRLIYKIIKHLSIALCVILTLWAVFFYFAILEEMNDELDDSLEDYSEYIMIRALGGDSLASESSNTNNQFYLREVSTQYAAHKPHVSYTDSMVYIPQKMETESARILTTIYRDAQGRYFELVVLTPTIEKADLQEAILYWVIFLYISLLCVILVVNIWVYKRSFRPLNKLLNWMNNYQLGSQNQPLDNYTDVLEFQQLNDTVLNSLHKAQKALEEQKLFIGNASHEVQTPLAVCRSRIENLMESDSLTEDQCIELDKIYQTLVYITKLNQTLLLLAKIDNQQFLDKKNIEVNSLIKKIADDYREVYSYKNIRIEVDQTGEFSIFMSESLLSILLNNLLKNTCTHNVEGGLVEVLISNKDIIFRNTGQPIALDTSQIFERFFKGSQSNDSTGLGLSLVKSICDLGQLGISYSFENGLHCFRIEKRIN